MTPDEPSQAAGQVISDPSAVSSLLRSQASRTVGRSELAHRHPDLSAVSPEAGVLDENALAGMDPGEGLALLAEMTRSSDQTLRARARLLATRIALRPSGVETPRGLGRPQLGLLTDPYAGADLDLDVTLNRLTGMHRPRLDDLVFRGWQRSSSAYVLVVDSSGSVAGDRLATAVLTVGALCHRIGAAELSVIAFWSRAVVLQPLAPAVSVSSLVDKLADLRGGGTTDIALALRAAFSQASLARAARREVLLLTDGVRTEGADPVPVAGAAASLGVRLHVLALTPPTGEESTGDSTCRALASAGAGRYAPLPSPLAAPSAVSSVLA